MYQEARVQANTENQSTSTVLVIDDEENIIELIKLGLKYEDFQVEAAL